MKTALTAACPFCAEEVPSERLPSAAAALYACPNCLNPVVLAWEDTRPVARPLTRARDIRHLAGEASIGGAILEALPKAIANLPVLPEVSQRILTMLKDPEASMPALASVVQEDQVIAVKVLKLANSPAYRGLHEVRGLDEACARLGMKAISNAVQAVANGNLYVTGDQRLRELMGRLWKHALATAHYAAGLGVILIEPHSEALFVAGLIHDIGKVVLLDIITSAYCESMSELRASEEMFDEVLRNFHPLAGLHVVQAWDLPPEFGVSAYCHHDPSLAPTPESANMAHIAALANAIAKAEGYHSGGPEEVFLSSHPSARHLGLGDVKLASLRVDHADELAALMELAGVDAAAPQGR